MKRIVVMVVIILFSMSLSGQQTEPERQLVKQDYLLKSKNQKTVGWVLLGSGAAMFFTGIIVGSSNSSDNPNEWFGPNFETGATILLGGIVAGLASIPFFISSASNARKAAIISFNNQKILLPQYGRTAVITQPSVMLKIRI